MANWFTKMSGAILNMRSFRVSDPGIVHYFGGPADSYAGKVVTVNGALQLSTVWACINLLADTISALPLQVFDRDAEGYTTVNRTHPLYSLLHDQPNADMTALEFWRSMIANLAAHGNAYAEISRSTRRVVALTPMRPEFIRPRRADDGGIVYEYHNGSGAPREIDQADILHIKGATFDGLVGLSPVSFARHTLGLAMAAEEASGRTLKNGMRPSGYIKAPGIIPKDQRTAAETMLERFKGSQNTGKVPLLEGGWEFVGMSLPPVDVQLLETRSFGVEEVCRWFRIPPHMVGHMDKSTSWGTGLEQGNLGFLTYVLDPILRSVEQAAAKALLSPGERAGVLVEYDRGALLRADSAGKAVLFASLAQNGLRTRNELRRSDNLPPMAGGDVLTAQSNLVPLDKLGAVPPMSNAAPNVSGQDTKQ